MYEKVGHKFDQVSKPIYLTFIKIDFDYQDEMGY
jgi:hypothetical protein